MKLKTLCVLLASLCARAAGAAQFNINDYTETELPGVPIAINASGEVLGTLASNGDMFTWLNGVTTDLGRGTPYGISDSGIVVGQRNAAGFAIVPSDPGTNLIPQILDFYDIKAISDSGLILGDTLSEYPLPTVFNAGSEYLLGIGGEGGEAVAVNSQNEIAYYDVQNWGNGTYDAYFVDSTGTHAIPSLGGEDITTPTAMNDLGWVVGTSSVAHDAYDGFLYSNGVTTDLGPNFTPAGINDAGLMVGNYMSASAIYLDGVETVIPGATKLTAINNAGDITGYSYSNTYGTHGFIWTPITAAPEPSSIVLAALGLIGLLAVGRRRA
jgi:probable HAF family extracellular repeat protein